MTEVRKENQLVAAKDSYELSRLNAVRHGILSRYTVLPWESPEEYEALHLALVAEYAPQGPTEAHLVEEIAGIVWRKRRLRLAENATFRKEFRSTVAYDGSSIMKSGLVGAWTGATKDFELLEEVLSMKPGEVTQELQEAAEALRGAEKAQKIIDPEHPETYSQAVERLLDGTREWWEEELEDEDSEYSPTPDSLLEFLEEEVIPYFSQRLAVLSNHGSIMAQAQGEALDVAKLENLSRYEIFLDRKLERTLSMLLKLQALRQEQEPGTE
jgi:hypothetical protein